MGGGFLSRIEITGVRNLERVSINPAPRINLMYGANGSGKSSFLEAIYLLGMGRSFRTSHVGQFISAGKESAVVFGESLSKKGISTTLGIEKSKGTTSIRINGRRITALSELAKRLPLQLIDPNVHLLIEGGPRFRRHYINWGMFHVEQGFFPVWRKFQRALKMRNAAIRARLPDPQVRIWHAEMARYGDWIATRQRDFIGNLMPFLVDVMAQVCDQKGLELRYVPGWNQEKGYEEQLDSSLERDREKGYTRYGPHRAEVLIMLGDTLARERVSRGEQKLLAVALRLAQVELMIKRYHRACVVLVDDLPSELDKERRERFLAYLSTLGCQVFVTATDKALFSGYPLGEKDGLFHVEHGIIQKMV